MKIIFLLFILTLYLSAQAQYFGRNKVQYEKFDFRVMQTENFRLLYYPPESTMVFLSGRMLERWNSRLRMIFNEKISESQPVILYANHADFQQTNVIGGLIPQGTGGVTEGFMNRIVIPLTGINEENDHVLGHELAHAFHYTIMKQSAQGVVSAGQMPLWFIEGMSEYLSVGSVSTLTAMRMRDAVLNKDVPSVDKMSSSYKYFPYRYGHALWAYIAGRWGDQVINEIFRAVLRKGWKAGFLSAIATPVDSVSDAWQSAIKNAFSPQLQNRILPSDMGKNLIKKADVNLSPEISPDGKYIAFLSSRDLFSIGLYLADAKTGTVLKKLSSSTTDAHFNSLRFINSSGAWSPDAKKLAYPVFKAGDNAITILNIATQSSDATFFIDDIDEITHLAWSPDGKYLMVSGSIGGVSDLYQYTLATGGVEKITHDLYSNIQPAYSPDGKMVAFVTDQSIHTNLDSLKYASVNIAFFRTDDPEKKLTFISLGAWAKHINPQFSPGGDALYFISDVDGFSDIYRYDIKTQTIVKITKIATGISGLTELSPAFSIARETGKMVFTVYNNSKYQINSIDLDTSGAGDEFIPDKSQYLKNASLPPVERKNNIVDTYLSSPSQNLPSGEGFLTQNYFPQLKLLYVGQVVAGVATNGHDIGIGGGATFLFSDLLGNNLLGLSAQVTGNFKDLGGQMVYFNKSHRINWGLSLSHIPYLSTTLRVDSDTVTDNGNSRTIRRYVLTDERVFEDGISLLTELPISENRRLEFSGGYTRISYDYNAEQINTEDAVVTGRRTINVEEPSSLDLFSVNAAYVGDYSFSGFTAPVSGRRYRFDIEPTSGSLEFLALNADYRHYIFINPLTVALRLFHYGRYLNDSEDDRLTPLFLGYETFVRGYSVYRFDLSNCVSTRELDSCPEFDRLVGSRIGIVNTEIRIPLLGTEQFSLLNFPYLPTDLLGFFEGGVAWTRNESPDLRWSKEAVARVPVFSAGAGARFNLFGVLIMQLYYAYPFQNPDDGWHWGFFFAPGW